MSDSIHETMLPTVLRMSGGQGTEGWGACPSMMNMLYIFIIISGMMYTTNWYSMMDVINIKNDWVLLPNTLTSLSLPQSQLCLTHLSVRLLQLATPLKMISWLFEVLTAIIIQLKINIDVAINGVSFIEVSPFACLASHLFSVMNFCI